LKRKPDIRRPWNAWQIAFRFGVAGCAVEIMRRRTSEPLFKVLFLLRGRPRLIWDRSTFDDALPARLSADRAQQRRKGRGARGMRLEIPIGRIHRLLDSIQIRELCSGKARSA